MALPFQEVVSLRPGSELSEFYASSQSSTQPICSTRSRRGGIATSLAPGETKPAAALIKDFLGRPFDFVAYQRWLNGE
jgi:thimet oligopeptidase